MLKLLNQDKKLIANIKNYSDLCIENELLTFDSTLSFNCPINTILKDDIAEERYIRTRENEYVIKEVSTKNSLLEVYCNLNFEELEGKFFEHFNTIATTIEECLNLAFAGTGWTVGSSNILRKRTIKLTNVTSFKILKEANKVFRAEFKVDTLNKKIFIFEELGEDKGTYFTESLNLKNIEIQSNTHDFITRLIVEGKDGLTIESINDNKKYIDNFQYSKKIKTYFWKDERYTSKESLKEDAEYKLNELSKPAKSYNLDIVDLAKTNDYYKNILDYKLGDTVTLLSKTHKLKEKQRIVKIIEYPHDPTKNTCELSNTILSFEDLQQDLQDAADTIDNITTDNGTVDGSTIDSIEKEQIKNFDIEVGKVVNLEVVNAKIDNLIANKADITSLNAVIANIGQLEATKANITDLNAINATITNLQVSKADIVDLTAATGKITILESQVAKIGVLEGDVANIQDIIGGNISSDNIQSGGITGDRLNMNTIFVNDANIVNVNASKVNAGEIDTSKVKVKSTDGAIEIAGATQQFRDKNNKVRIQMGKDTKGDFNFIIKGEDGTTTLIDHNGVKESAIADDLIKDNMIAPDAIGEKQIDYDSFSTGFNKDTNTTQIKATKVKLDNEKQTLDVAFTSLKKQANESKTQTESNTTQINVANGKIETAIANTTIVKDGKEVLLKDDYNTTIATVDSMKNTISSHTTKIDENTGKIGTVESKTNVLERDLNSMSSKISATETIVNTHTTEISIANSNASNAQSTANTAVTKADKAQTDANKNKADIITVNTEVTATKNKVSGIEQDLDSVTTRVGSVESTTTSHTATINNHTNSLNAVDGKINTAKTDAINTAKSDATTKANDAKNQAISSAATDAQNKANKALNDAKSYTGAEITKVNSTMSSKFAEIKTTTDSITQSVSATNKEVETVKVNITNLQIGGRNLARNTDKYITTGSSTGMIIDADSIKKQAGKKITVSVDIEITNGISSNNDGRIGAEFSVQFTDGSSQYFGTWETVGTAAKTIKRRLSTTIIINANKTIATVKDLGIYIQRTTSGTFKIGRPKVELGDKATDWTAAPEDISKEILDITTEKVNQAKADIKVTTDAISSKVSQVESTTNSINGKVTAHESRIASAEQKITPSSIINTVSKTIDDKVNVVDRKLAEMKLENDNFQVKIEGTHYRNEFQSSNWSILTGGGSFYREALPNGYSSYKGDSKAWRWIYQAQSASVRFNEAITENGIYSVSFYVKSLNGYGLSMICDINDRSSSDPARYIAPNTWTLVKFENITVNNYTSDVFHFLDIGVTYGDNLVRDLLISNIMINKGTKCVEWTENSNEMYSGVLQMNKNGVDCFFEDGTYAHMGRYGLRYYRHGMSKPYQYVTFNAKISRIRNGYWTKVYLSEFFRGKQINIDFQLFVTLGAFNLDAYVNGSTNGALRVQHAEWSDWQAHDCSLLVRPCLQKIGLDSGKRYGWDSATTSAGATANEGEADVIIFAQM